MQRVRAERNILKPMVARLRSMFNRIANYDGLESVFEEKQSTASKGAEYHYGPCSVASLGEIIIKWSGNTPALACF